jgi:stage II sporulation protein E
VKNYDGFYYAFICDGMGSGEDAALTSQLCRVFLEKMLACGNKKSTTLEMLNHFLTSRMTESFTTVDLLEIDLYGGVATFLKSGAVPSYVIRRGNLYKIASGTFPVGILPEVSAEVTEFELCDGDTVMLCSDGVYAAIELCEEKNPSFFSEVVSRRWTDDTELMAQRILSAVTGERSEDDMTVMLIHIARESA